jgi:hypothetical protein
MRNRYVYLHLAVKPREKGQVFYVGIGTHGKIKKYDRMKSNDSRNDYWKKTVNKYGIKRVVFSDNLTTEQACGLEKDLIETFQGNINSSVKYLTNLTTGGETGFNKVDIGDNVRAKMRESHLKRKRGKSKNSTYRGVSVRSRGDFQFQYTPEHYKQKGIPFKYFSQAKLASDMYYNFGQYIPSSDLEDELKSIRSMTNEECIRLEKLFE